MKRYLKILFAVAMLCISILLIISKKSLNSKLAIVTKDNAELKVASGSEILEISNNEGEDAYNTNNIEAKSSSIFNIGDKLNLDLTDKANPNSVEKIDTKVLEDNMIINLTKPNDNGTNYEYIIKNKSNQKKMKFYVKSEIKGYSYTINNQKQDEASNEINKMDESPIVEQNLNWSKDYYLHIKSFDGNGNYSENRTFKLDLPSNGVTVKYIDINSNTEISKSENINGIANQEYDASNLSKQIDGYQLLSNQGELEGVLKKEKINILYEYAKNASLIINYIDRATGAQIYSSTNIDGYEGKEIEVKAKDIYGYSCENKTYITQMHAGQNNINIYYNEIPKGTISVKYIDKDTNNEIADRVILSDYVNNTYSSEAKDIDEYELIETPNNWSGYISEGEVEVIYYYKRNNVSEVLPPEGKQEVQEEKIGTEDREESIMEKTAEQAPINKSETSQKSTKEIRIKYMDFDTKQLLKSDTISTDEKKIRYVIKPIEGYKLMGDDDFNGESESIIDELINSLREDKDFIQANTDNGKTFLPKMKDSNVIAEYEIVLNCDDSDYIIYYKKG